MLGKLLKYELPAMGRKLLPLYAAWAVTAVLLGLAANTVSSKSDFAMVMAILLYVALATAITVMVVVMIIQRYKNSLLGDEAYFSQALPVSTAAHIGNKLISALIWVAVTGLVSILTFMLILIVGGLIGNIYLTDLYNGYIATIKDLGLYLLKGLLLGLASVTKTIMQIYAAITIGHQVRDHRTLASIGAYIGILIFESTVSRIVLGIAGLITSNLYIADLQMLFWPGLIMAAAFSAIYFFVCKYLMEKRLNLA